MAKPIEAKTFADYVARYGEPVYRFTVNQAGLTQEQVYMGNMPEECCVFKIENISRVMTVCRYGDNWLPNTGERYIINQLLEDYEIQKSLIDVLRSLDGFSG